MRGDSTESQELPHRSSAGVREGAAVPTNRPSRARALRGVCVSLALACVAGAQSPTPATSVLELTLRWHGPLPKGKPFQLPPGFGDRHPEQAEHCGLCAEKGTLKDERLLVDPTTRGIRDVAISLRGVKSTRRLAPVTLDNRDCRFAPHVVFVPIGQEVTIKNSDPFTHNAHIVGRGRRHVWNGIVGPGKETATPKILLSGIYTVTCDVHPWMKATLIAARHPFCGVTDKQGRLVLRDLPSGKDRKIVLWHETLGVARLSVDLAPKETVRRELDQRAFRR